MKKVRKVVKKVLTTHKVNDIDDMDLESIFTAIKLFSPKTFAILNNITTMTTYLSANHFKYRYGEKYVQPIIEKFLESGGWNKLGTMIGQDNDEKWSRILTAIYAEYNPLDSYERHEVYEGSEEGESTENVNLNTEAKLEQSTGNKYYGFNSSQGVPVSDTNVDSTTTTSGSSADNEKSISNSLSKDHSIDINGRDISAGKLLDEEIRFRLTNLIEIIYHDISDYICVMIY